MLKRIAEKLLHFALDKPLPPLSVQEDRFLTELYATFRALPVLETTNLPSSEAAWFGNMNRLRELVLNQNPRSFLQWDVVTSTMFITFARFIYTELKFVKHRADWNMRWRLAIKESPVGHPLPYVFYHRSSANLIHHAYHIAQFEEKTGIQVQDVDFVFEFGGGYGSMCRLFHNLGFRGKYIIFDLASFSALQRYFLQTLDLPVKSVAEFMKSKTGIACVSDIQDLKTLLEDTVKANNTMFIATWSISESPISIRDLILPLVSEFELFLVAYQSKFEEVDNINFFNNWKQINKSVTWHQWKIEHIPGSSYLVGRAANGL